MKLVLAGLAGVAVVVVVGAVTLGLRIESGDSGPAGGSFRGSEPPVTVAMPPFALRDQDDRLVRTADLRGRVVVLTFLDTKCTEACPVIAAHVAQAWELLTAAERAQSVAVAISSNPRDDTRGRIRAFLRRHRAEDTIRYLTGPVPVMSALWRRFQILSALDSGDASVHSAPVRIYGRGLVWLATQHAGADLTPESLAHDIRVALARG